MIDMPTTTNMKTRKLRTVSVNERGQLVIPEDIRKDFGIKGGTILVMIEAGDELVLRKESEVIAAVEDKFWDALSHLAMKNAWSREDDVWDEIAKKN